MSSAVTFSSVSIDVYLFELSVV